MPARERLERFKPGIAHNLHSFRGVELFSGTKRARGVTAPHACKRRTNLTSARQASTPPRRAKILIRVERFNARRDHHGCGNARIESFTHGDTLARQSDT